MRCFRQNTVLALFKQALAAKPPATSALFEKTNRRLRGQKRSFFVMKILVNPWVAAFSLKLTDLGSPQIVISSMFKQALGRPSLEAMGFCAALGA